jgi:hypothetical protein
MRSALILAVALALSGCGNGETRAYSQLINAANQVCQVNGGVSYISYPDWEKEIVSCGYRCSRATGFVIYSGNAHCRNGAMFSIQVKE